MMVADITDEILLGADILFGDESGKADILLSRGEMTLRGEVIPLEQRFNPLFVRKVCLADTYVVPGRTEVVADVFIDRRENDENQDWIIESSPLLNEKYAIAMTATLVDIQKNTTVKVRLLNPLEEATTLEQEMVVGYASQVTQVRIITETEDTSDLSTEVIRRAADREPPSGSTTKDGNVTLASRVPEHLKALYEEAVIDRSETEAHAIAQLLLENEEVFSSNSTDLGLTHLTEHVIDTGTAKPIKQRPRPVPMAFAEEDKKAVEKLLDQGSIRPSSSPWAAPMVFVRKKNGEVRPCVDYRRLNNVTCKDAFPLPRTRDCLDAVAGATLFTSLDITSAYNQIPIKKEDIPKTAFTTKYGLFEYTTMPFGLCNAPATFQRVMEIALAGLQWTTCLIYLDDVLIFGKDFNEQIQRIRAVLTQIKAANLKLKPSKCHLLQREVGFLGHILSAEGVKPAPDNIEKIMKWSAPTSVKEVQSFLGMTNYYRRFIQDYSTIARPLIDLTKKDKPFKWTDQCESAFLRLQKLLTSTPIMAHPREHENFILDTDACDVSVGAVLSQVQDGVERVIAYGSKSLSKCQRNYCVTDRELYAVRYFTEHYRSYLLGRKFLVRTDHQALKWIFTMKEPKSRVARWIEALSEFSFEIEHRSGTKHGNADGMSRCPNPWTCECKNYEALRCGPCKKCRRKNELMEGTLPGRSTEGEPHNQKARVTKADLRSSTKQSPFGNTSRKQMADASIGPVYQWVERGTRPPASEVTTAGPATRHYLLIWNSLVIHEGVLHRKTTQQGGTNPRLQVIVPDEMKEEIMKQMHDCQLSGHLGEKRTRKKLQQKFYWFNMRADVSLYVKRCDECVMTKGTTNPPKAPLGTLTTGSPWDRLSIDIIGPLPESSRGNKYILVATDHFTKWVEIFAIPDQQAETCATILVNEVFARYGCPYDLHSDQGRNFDGAVFKEVCKILEIRKTRTSPYHPKGNGQVERFNRTLLRMIKAYLKGTQSEWDKNLGCLAGAYRASVHESTGFTPNFLLFGQEVRFPAQLLYCPPAEGDASYGEYAERIKESLGKAHQTVRQHLQVEAKRQKDNFDCKSTLRRYHPGDLVWYASCPSEEKHLAPKLRRKYIGPVVIVARIDDLLYRIKIKKQSERVVHYDKLLPYFGTSRPRWVSKATPK